MRLRPIHVLLAMISLGCGDDDAASPGTELGPCVQDRFCEQPLVCTEGICVHPGQLDDDGAAEGPVDASWSDSGEGDGMGEGPRYDLGGGTTPGEGDGGGDGSGGGGAEVYCSPSQEGACICGHTADYGPLEQPCSESTVGSPSLCCASEGWPGYGGCSCWVQSCRRISYDTCLCGIGAVDPEDEPVSSCTPDGGVCCRDTAGTCACWTSITTCLEGDVQVESCSVEQLDCGDSTRVPACN